MEQFLKLCNDYEKEYGVDITFLNTYLLLEDAIDFIKNRNGMKIDIIVNNKGQDIGTPIYVD
jgi:short-subunit dehydrogenase